MGDISFGATPDMLKNALTGASESHAAIANNIANVNTPGFKRTDATFKDSLAAMMPEPPPDNELQLVVDNERQIGSGPPTDPQPFSVTMHLDETQQMRVDGSNVDVDQEMAKLSLNSAYSQTMGQLLSVQYQRIRQAIQEHA
jgi:flagellar basal-body rod protein FlgB